MNPPNQIKKSAIRASIPRGVIVLGMVSLFMDTSSEFVHSLLPAYFLVVFQANMSTIGFIEGIAEATASITKVFSGAVSDWLGKRKILISIGYGLAAITKPIFPVAPTLSIVAAARFLDRFGKGIRGAPRDALIADITPREIRGAAYGLRQSLDTIGAFVGPILAIGLMIVFHDNIRLVMWFAVIPAAASVAFLLFGIKEPQSISKTMNAKFSLNRSMVKKLPNSFWAIVQIGCLFSLSRFSEAFLTLKGIELGLALHLTPLILITMCGVYALSAYPAGLFADAFDKRTLLLIGLVTLVLADIFLAFSTSLIFVFLGAIFWGIHMGLTQGILSTLVANVAPDSLRGTAFGLFNLTGGLCLLLASTIAGVVWDLYGSQATFILGALFATGTIIIVAKHKIEIAE